MIYRPDEKSRAEGIFSESLSMFIFAWTATSRVAIREDTLF